MLLPGYGPVLLNRQPVKPEHNSLRGATGKWCDGSQQGVDRVHGRERNLRICRHWGHQGHRAGGRSNSIFGREMRQILSHLYSQPLELGILVAAVAVQQRERERYVAVGERDDSTRGTDGNRNLGGQCILVISPLIDQRH